MVLGKLRQLVLPLVPEFREAVQEDDQRPFSGGHVVQTNTIYFRIFVLSM